MSRGRAKGAEWVLTLNQSRKETVARVEWAGVRHELEGLAAAAERRLKGVVSDMQGRLVAVCFAMTFRTMRTHARGWGCIPYHMSIAYTHTRVLPCGWAPSVAGGGGQCRAGGATSGVQQRGSGGAHHRHRHGHR